MLYFPSKKNYVKSNVLTKNLSHKTPRNTNTTSNLSHSMKKLKTSFSTFPSKKDWSKMKFKFKQKTSFLCQQSPAVLSKSAVKNYFDFQNILFEFMNFLLFVQKVKWHYILMMFMVFLCFFASKSFHLRKLKMKMLTLM